MDVVRPYPPSESVRCRKMRPMRVRPVGLGGRGVSGVRREGGGWVSDAAEAVETPVVRDDRGGGERWCFNLLLSLGLLFHHEPETRRDMAERDDASMYGALRVWAFRSVSRGRQSARLGSVVAQMESAPLLDAAAAVHRPVNVNSLAHPSAHARGFVDVACSFPMPGSTWDRNVRPVRIRPVGDAGRGVSGVRGGGAWRG